MRTASCVCGQLSIEVQDEIGGVGVARSLGYAEMRLDSLPGVDAAVALYARMGFAPIAPYDGPTPAGTIFMGLRL